MAITPGFLKFDGVKWVVDDDIVGATGPAGPAGEPGVTFIDLSDLDVTSNILPIERGGTGLDELGLVNTVLMSTGAVATWTTLLNANIASNAAISVSKLAPGSNSQVLQTVSGVTSWAAAPLSVPGGSNAQFQINSLDSFAGVSGLTWNVSTSRPVMPNGWEVTSGSFTSIFSNTPTNNRTITFQDSTHTLVGRDTTDTLTGKTINLSSNTITDTSMVAEDLLVCNGSKFVRRAKGTEGTFLGVVGGVLTWSIPPVTFSTPSGTGVMRVVSGSMQATGFIGSANQILRTNSGGTNIEWATPSVFTAPTGTGVMNVVGGTMSSAGSLGSAGYYLRTNLSGNGIEWVAISSGSSSSGPISTIQLSNGAGGFSPAGSVLGGTGFISFNTVGSPADAGALRFGNADSFQIRNGTSTANICAFQSNSSNQLYIGQSASSTLKCTDLLLSGSSSVRLYPTSGGNVQIGASNVYIASTSGGAFYITTTESTNSVAINSGAGNGLFVYRTGSATNVGIGTASSSHGEAGDQSGALYIANLGGSIGTPSGGGFLWVSTGQLKYRGPSGTVTIVGAADPHCKKCGRDFMHEWENAYNDEHLNVCMPCLLDSMASLGIDVDSFCERRLY